ncbi:MAG: ATP-binding cassette domain-containing protein [Gorillibacterium sp.]|nr:ATP-binding cassette domain-containing protein [Gorillibacterium sp.]
MIIRNLSKSYQEDTILNGISFQASPGEFIAIIGASGSGKSTLLRCLTLQEKWDRGEYVIDGNDIIQGNFLARRKVRRNWAFLEERPTLHTNKSAVQNVLEARWRHMSLWRKVTRRSSMDEHVHSLEFLEKVGLLDKGLEKVEKLSGGERQRVALAKALIQEAKMIAADDPVKGLDPESVNGVMENFRNVAKRENVVLLVAMQQLELAERYATRIIGLSGGKIVLDIKARKLTQREKELVL